MYFLLNFISPFIEFTFLFFLVNAFIGRKNTIQKIDIIMCIISTLIIGVIPANHVLLLLIAAFIIDFTYVLLINNKNLTNTLIAYTLYFISLIAIQFLVVMLTSLLNINGESYIGQLVCNILTLLIIIITSLFVRINSIYTIFVTASMPVKLLLINTYLILFSTMITFKISNSTIYMNIPYFLAVIAFIFAINIGIMYYDTALKGKNKELESYKKNIPIYETLIAELRANQHEYSNRLQTLQNLPYMCKNYEELSAALLSYTDKLNKSSHVKALLNLNTPLLAASLYTLTEKATKLGININFNIHTNTICSNAPEYVLSDLACILLQNAIEATTDNGSIYVELSNIDNSCLFIVRNSVNRTYSKTELASFFKKGYTTKNNKEDISSSHGFGLYSLSKTFEKYHGAFGYNCIEFDNGYWIEMQFEV